MATYLLAATPVHGHVSPVLRVGAHLVERGHRVVMLTGSRFEAAVTARGLEFEPLSGRADFDDRDQDAYLPDRHSHTGLQRVQYEIRSIFVETIPDQARSMRALIGRLDPDAILVDGAFAGVAPFLSAAGTDPATASRPPILALGVTPLSQSSRMLAPFGMAMFPAKNRLEQLRYRMLGAVARRVLFRSTQQAARKRVAEAGGVLRGFVMDSSRHYDSFLQTGPEGLEYPRPDLGENTVFVGVLPQESADITEPAWWGDLDGGRPVIHVTQGTIDNGDFDRLVRPTFEALRDLDCIVVATTGGREVDALGELPDNARAASYLSYADLLPRASIVITNGGYGGVQAALAHGVPVIVAGTTEEKPEVAARVQWSGAGINLRTGTPTPEQIRGAVRSILESTKYTHAARMLADQAAAHNTLAEIETEIRLAHLAYRATTR